eukprot:1423900-Ditylum_brightwellii.AAC.1
MEEPSISSASTLQTMSIEAETPTSEAKHKNDHDDYSNIQDDKNINSVSANDTLCGAIRESLDRKGTLCKIRALLRSEIFSCLEDSTASLIAMSTMEKEGEEGEYWEERDENSVVDNVGRKKMQPTRSPSTSSPTSPPAQPIENTIINEMIREYMLFNGHNHTARVFSEEVLGDATHGGGFPFTDKQQNSNGTASSSFGREVIMQDLGIVDYGISTVAPWVSNDQKQNVKKLPLLYGIVETLKRKNFEREQQLS